MREGDIILKVASIETNSVATLRSAVDAQLVGSWVEVLIIREGRQQKLSVLLEETLGIVTIVITSLVCLTRYGYVDIK